MAGRPAAAAIAMVRYPPKQHFPLGSDVEDERTGQRATVIVPSEKAMREMPDSNALFVRWHKTLRETWTDPARLRPAPRW
jgi:outer membrane usher protein FimD/PapC